jgi:hypothetical protein
MMTPHEESGKLGKQDRRDENERVSRGVRGADRLSHGGKYYRVHRGQERRRKEIEYARFANAAYGFVERHPEFANRWHPVYSETEHHWRLSRREDSDWRKFLRKNGWSVGEKGRNARIAEYHPPDFGVPRLSPKEEAARRKFHLEALGQAPESYAAVYP